MSGSRRHCRSPGGQRHRPQGLCANLCPVKPSSKHEGNRVTEAGRREEGLVGRGRLGTVPLPWDSQGQRSLTATLPGIHTPACSK